jgi:hypothetical protein
VSDELFLFLHILNGIGHTVVSLKYYLPVLSTAQFKDFISNKSDPYILCFISHSVTGWIFTLHPFSFLLTVLTSTFSYA